MDIPELILITWNRHHYLQKTLETLLADPTDFRLYCWDNASGDETRDLIADLKDDRIVEKHFHAENVNQVEPCRWFFDKAKSRYVGKIDDDIIYPHGWTAQLVEALGQSDRFGMIGCWNFMESDWDAEAAKLNTINISGVNILRTVTLGGCSFIATRELIKQYVTIDQAYGLPINRLKMTLDGHVSGYILPVIMAHHMDDPRSPYCKHYSDDGRMSSLTARVRGFDTIEAYSAWIAQDARTRLTIPIEEQIARIRQARRETGILGKAKRGWRKLRKKLGRTC